MEFIRKILEYIRMMLVLLPVIGRKIKPVSYKYVGDIDPNSRFIAIGFDDFRISDFSRIIPLFEKYGYRATFNRITWNAHPTWLEKLQIRRVLQGGHEIGDHTIMHAKYIFDEPLFNGQSYEHPDGNQTPFPSDEQMGCDRGDGKNVFGISLSSTIGATYRNPSWCPPANKESTWGGAEMADYQQIREYFSLMNGKDGLIELMDELSNKYLGTKGSSRGSWSDTKQCYTGGIYTGCKTSANHEIWERYLSILSLFYKDIIGPWFQFRTWSFPGSKLSWLYFEKDGRYFYDANHKIYRNNLAQMKSSLSGTYRSWIDCLRQAGYCISHDSQSPSRMDGLTKPAMAYQLTFNASLSRPDAVVYSSNRTLSFTKISSEYPKSFFKQNASKEIQMYNAEGSYREAIESWRKNMSNGLVWGEVIDSNSSYSMLTVLEGLLKYCKQTGVQVVTKQEAYDICFNHTITKGNLLYNPELRNTAKEFLPEADVPSNPDGYEGDCYIKKNQGEKILVTRGDTRYIHFGIPYGQLRFSMECKGDGELTFRLIKNHSPYEMNNPPVYACIKIASNKRFSLYEQELTISDNPKSNTNQICEAYRDKIIGVVFDYSSGLEVKNMKLELI